MLGAPDLDAVHRAVFEVAVPEAVRAALLEFLRALVLEYQCDETNSLLTDRSFLVKAVKMIRGRAALDGRSDATVDDLQVLEWMTTFRVPTEVHEVVPNLILRVSGR